MALENRVSPCYCNSNMDLRGPVKSAKVDKHVTQRLCICEYAKNSDRVLK